MNLGSLSLPIVTNGIQLRIFIFHTTSMSTKASSSLKHNRQIRRSLNSLAFSRMAGSLARTSAGIMSTTLRCSLQTELKIVSHIIFYSVDAPQMRDPEILEVVKFTTFLHAPSPTILLHHSSSLCKNPLRCVVGEP
uniref:(northern house mosquito) hypothetical protein n=1 Tax=Culex pipiens TaxID=7175 RepID=A0A8D8KR49_CULPI